LKVNLGQKQLSGFASMQINWRPSKQKNIQNTTAPQNKNIVKKNLTWTEMLAIFTGKNLKDLASKIT
jgi:hypothetical protein